MALNFNPRDERNPMLDPGDYILEIVDYGRWDTDGGKPVVKVASKVLHGEAEGQRQDQNYFMVKGAKWRLAELFEAIGKIDAPNIDLDDIAAMKKLMVGCRYFAKVSHREYNGKTYCEIQKPVALSHDMQEMVSDRPRATPTTGDDGGGFEETPNNTSVSDDDIPF